MMKKVWLGVIMGIAISLSVISLNMNYYAPSMKVLDEASNSTIPEPKQNETTTIKPIYNSESLSLKIHAIVNQKRIENNVTELVWDETISGIAKAHSNDMIERNFFAHDNPDGLGPVERGIVFGYDICGDKENATLYFDRLAVFENEQKTNNEKMESINLKVDDYNKKSRDYGRLHDYYYTFKPNDQIAYYDLQQKFTALEKQRIEIETEQSKLIQKDKALDLEYSNLNSMYDSLEGKVFDGLTENLSSGFLYESYTEQGPIIIYNWLTEDQVSEVIVEGWMNSEGHRKNMLNPFLQTQGLGASINPDTNEVFVTENLC